MYALVPGVFQTPDPEGQVQALFGRARDISSVRSEFFESEIFRIHVPKLKKISNEYNVLSFKYLSDVSFLLKIF